MHFHYKLWNCITMGEEECSTLFLEFNNRLSAEPHIISRKLQKNSNFQRHFPKNGLSYRREILRDNLEDQAQWHISKLCSFF